MEQRQFGKSGLRLSILSLGAMTMGESEGFMKGVGSDEAEALWVLDASLDAGIDTIDTANVYSEGRSEELVGAWMKGKRQRITLLTKCRFPTVPGMHPNEYGLSRKSVIWNCEESLRRLQTDVIDLYQVHMQDRTAPIDETLRALDDLQRAGKIRYAGCSNYTGYRLTESLWSADRHDTVRFDGIQLQWSLVSREAERELIPASRAFGLGVLAWSPLASGFLTGKYQRGEQPPEGSRLAAWKDGWAGRATEQNWRTLDAVQAVAKRRESTAAVVSLAWLLQRPEVTSVIVGARTTSQLAENLKASALKLTPEEIAGLDKASAPDWGYPYSMISGREPW